MSPVRRLIEFPSGSSTCAAWHYPGTRGACVVMAGGFAVTKEPATDRFATAFCAAGFDVLAFDYRGFGGSGGAPLVARLDDHREDWRAAIAFAKALDGVDPTKIALWGFSISGGLVLEAAADDASVAAVIAAEPARRRAHRRPPRVGVPERFGSHRDPRSRRRRRGRRRYRPTLANTPPERATRHPSRAHHPRRRRCRPSP